MMFKPLPTLKRIIDIVESNNLQCDKRRIDSSLKDLSAPHPWYVQSALGIAAWIAAFLFWAYFTTLGRHSNISTNLPIGIFFYIAGIFMYRYKPISITWRQLSLSLSLTGMLMSVILIQEMSARPWVAGLFLLVAESIIFWFHFDPVRRFIAVTNGLPAVLMILFSINSPFAYQLMVALGIYAVYVLWSRNHWQFKVDPNILKPIKYGLPIALFVIIHGLVTNGTSLNIETWALSNIITAIILANICYKQLERHKMHTDIASLVFMFVTIAIAALTTINSPGVLVSITVIFLGFQNSSKLLTLGAILAFIIFMGHLYLTLQLNLISKSMLLSGSGIVFLGAAFLIHRLLAKLEHTP